jgi:hypothetical protein
MLLNKIKLLTRQFHPRCKQDNETRKQRFKVHLLQEDTIWRTYCYCLNQYLEQRAMSLDINTDRQDFKAVMINTATEVLRKRYKSIRKKGLTVQNDYIASLVNDMKRKIRNQIVKVGTDT